MYAVHVTDRKINSCKSSSISPPLRNLFTKSTRLVQHGTMTNELDPLPFTVSRRLEVTVLPGTWTPACVCIYQPQWTKVVGRCQVYFGCWKESCLLLWPWPDTVTADSYLLIFWTFKVSICSRVQLQILTADMSAAAVNHDPVTGCICLIETSSGYILFFFSLVAGF